MRINQVNDGGKVLIMNTKDICHLIGFPVFSFLAIAAGALFFSNLYSRYSNELETENQMRQQKFVQFVENVKSGKWQLATDQWIEGMRHQRSSAEAEHKTVVPLIEFLRFTGWFGFILAALNVLVVLYVRDNIQKRQKASVRVG